MHEHLHSLQFLCAPSAHHQHLKIFSHYYCISICEMTCFRTSEPLAHFISSFYWVHSCLRKGLLAAVGCKQDERWRSLNQYCQQTLNFKHTLKLSILVECSKQFMVSQSRWEKFIRRNKKKTSLVFYYCSLAWIVRCGKISTDEVQKQKLAWSLTMKSSTWSIWIAERGFKLLY